MLVTQLLNLFKEPDRDVDEIVQSDQLRTLP